MAELERVRRLLERDEKQVCEILLEVSDSVVVAVGRALEFGSAHDGEDLGCGVVQQSQTRSLQVTQFDWRPEFSRDVGHQLGELGFLDRSHEHALGLRESFCITFVSHLMLPDIAAPTPGAASGIFVMAIIP